MKINLRLRPSALAFVLLASLLAVSVALAASVTIDTFDFAAQVVETTGPGQTVDGFTSDASILGTERDIQVNSLTGNVTRIRVGPPRGELVFTLGPGDTGIGYITYDGVDGNADLDLNGLGGVDLTGGGTNDSLHFEAVFNDVPFPVEFRVYSGRTESDYLSYQFTLPGAIDLDRHVDFLIPFTAFSSNGNGADFTNVGAFRIILDGTDSPGAKLNLDLFGSDSWRDFGDAPLSYGEVTHRPDGLRLGVSVDAEAAQVYTANAAGDDADQSDDEDGVSRTAGVNWSIAGGGSVDVDLNGCTAFPCYLNGWVDWDKDGVFEAGEQIFSDRTLAANVEQTLTFTIGGTPAFNTTYFARFRVCSSGGQCNTPGGSAGSGEVEDYLWAFGPTAIELNSFVAQSGSSLQYVLILAIAAALLLLGITIFTWVRQHQKA